MPGDAAIGSSVPRLDGVAKVTGQAQFADDEPVVGVWWGATVRSPHPRAPRQCDVAGRSCGNRDSGPGASSGPPSGSGDWGVLLRAYRGA